MSDSRLSLSQQAAALSVKLAAHNKAADGVLGPSLPGLHPDWYRGFDSGNDVGKEITHDRYAGGMTSGALGGGAAGLLYEALRGKTEDEKKQQVGQKLLRYLRSGGIGAGLGAAAGGAYTNMKYAEVTTRTHVKDSTMPETKQSSENLSLAVRAAALSVFIKQAGPVSEYMSSFNPLNMYGGGIAGGLGALVMPTRSLARQAELDSTDNLGRALVNVLVPGVGPYRGFKRMGAAIRSPEMKTLRKQRQADKLRRETSMVASDEPKQPETAPKNANTPEKKEAGWGSEMVGMTLNPLSLFGGNYIGGLTALGTPTRTLDEQAKSDEEMLANLFVPGRGAHNYFKRIGAATRSPEMLHLRNKAKQKKLQELEGELNPPKADSAPATEEAKAASLAVRNSELSLAEKAAKIGDLLTKQTYESHKKCAPIKSARVYEAAERVEGEKPKEVYESHKKCAPGEFGMNKEGGTKKADLRGAYLGGTNGATLGGLIGGGLGGVGGLAAGALSSRKGRRIGDTLRGGLKGLVAGGLLGAGAGAGFGASALGQLPVGVFMDAAKRGNPLTSEEMRKHIGGGINPAAYAGLTTLGTLGGAGIGGGLAGYLTSDKKEDKKDDDTEKESAFEFGSKVAQLFGTSKANLAAGGGLVGGLGGAALGGLHGLMSPGAEDEYDAEGHLVGKKRRSSLMGGLRGAVAGGVLGGVGGGAANLMSEGGVTSLAGGLANAAPRVARHVGQRLGLVPQQQQTFLQRMMRSAY